MASENAQLIGLSRQVALGRELDVLANNLANINTTGFKRDAVAFQTYVSRGRDESFPLGDRPLAFVIDRGVRHDLSSGPTKLTGNPFDLALQGDAFFAVQTPQGERYTRNGGFALNSQGQLVTSEGYQVLGDNGPISFVPEDKDISFTADGTISTQQGPKGRLRLVSFPNPQQLDKAGTSLFATSQAPQPATNVRVVQGALEGSNVQGVAEMSRLLEVSRAYQDLSGLLQKSDDLRRTAIERLAQVQA